uniref:Secreted protein n=1 Tax=Achlya hypogyna TaxID=1202772 RepID=A0A0A7CP05_ACHHY|nr:secreted protein [Achlya hypogyna]
MKACVLFVGLLSTALAAPATTAPVPTLNRFNGVCKKDADCKAFPGTVCVQIVSGDYSQGKCTPNYGTKPVCRGGQAGLCPSYQDPSLGYLNTQCVLIDKAMQPATDTDAIVPVSKDNATTVTPSSSSLSPATTAASSKTPLVPATTATTLRYLLVSETNATTAPPTSSSGSASSSGGPAPRTPLKAQACPTNPSLTLADPACWFTTEYQNTTRTVQYQCVDYDMCLSQSLCNNRGTCQANAAIDVMLPRTYSCRCYAGFTGTKCEKSDGTADCDVDCGQGGACIDNKCSCYAGYVGKNLRCDKCTSNAACENNNTCNLEAGTCTCAAGFIGPSCGGKSSVCAGITCSHGGFIDASSGKTCQCNCPKCSAGTACTRCGGENGTDCSTCPASALLANSAVAAGPLLALAVSAIAFLQ